MSVQPAGYALNDVDLIANEYVFTREDGSVRPAVRTVQLSTGAAVTRFSIVFPIALR